MRVEKRENSNFITADNGKYIKWGGCYFRMAHMPLSVDVAEVEEVDESEGIAAIKEMEDAEQINNEGTEEVEA